MRALTNRPPTSRRPAVSTISAIRAFVIAESRLKLRPRPSLGHVGQLKHLLRASINPTRVTPRAFLGRATNAANVRPPLKTLRRAIPHVLKVGRGPKLRSREMPNDLKLEDSNTSFRPRNRGTSGDAAALAKLPIRSAAPARYEIPSTWSRRPRTGLASGGNSCVDGARLRAGQMVSIPPNHLPDCRQHGKRHGCRWDPLCGGAAPGEFLLHRTTSTLFTEAPRRKCARLFVVR